VEGSPAVLKADRGRPPEPRPTASHAKSGSAPPRQTTLLLRDPMTVALQPCLDEVEPAPRARLASELIAYHQPDHPVSVQYRGLLGQLIPPSADRKGRTLLFASLASGSGTTTALLNLAISAAVGRQQTVVVDANLRRPALGHRLGLPATAGLQEVLAGAVALERVIHKTAQADLHALTAGTTAAPTLPTEAIRWVVAWLRERFEVIFVDGPLCTDAELAVLLPAADAIYLVVDQAEASQPKVRLATRTISQLGGRVAGYIITQG